MLLDNNQLLGICIGHVLLVYYRVCVMNPTTVHLYSKSKNYELVDEDIVELFCLLKICKYVLCML